MLYEDTGMIHKELCENEITITGARSQLQTFIDRVTDEDPSGGPLHQLMFKLVPMPGELQASLTSEVVWSPWVFTSGPSHKTPFSVQDSLRAIASALSLADAGADNPVRWQELHWGASGGDLETTIVWEADHLLVHFLSLDIPLLLGFFRASRQFPQLRFAYKFRAVAVHLAGLVVFEKGAVIRSEETAL